MSIAAARAPTSAGVYFFLGAHSELLYVGKAAHLHTRLAQHAHAKPGAGRRLAVLYQRVADVRWEVLPDEEAAATREADVIVALRPPFNASIAGDGRWNYVVVEPEGDGLRFDLTGDAVVTTSGRAHGCFPHLGRGVSSRPAIACSDGYTALLRLLWATSCGRRDHVPTRITRAAPDTFTTPVPTDLRPPLHAFLSGTTDRLLAGLGSTAAPHLAPALGRDRTAAAAFFRHGPRALRRLRLRHREPRGPWSRARIEAVLAAELREAIGDFTLPPPLDERDEILGRRAHRWARS